MSHLDEPEIMRLGWQTEQPRSRLETEWRVLRALSTMRTPGVVKTTMGGVRSNMPSYVHDETDLKWQDELVAEDDEVLEMFRPDRRDLSDWDTALRWFIAAAYSPRHHDDRPRDKANKLKLGAFSRQQQVIKWRSYGIADGAQPTWRFIGRQMNSDHVRVKRLYDEGIDRAWNKARSSDWAG